METLTLTVIQDLFTKGLVGRNENINGGLSNTSYWGAISSG